MNAREHEFEQDARQLLRQSELELQPALLGRIAQARGKALRVERSSWIMQHRPWFAGAAVAALVGLAVVLGQPALQGTDEETTNEMLADSPDFYGELDFYLWLAESDMGKRG